MCGTVTDQPPLAPEHVDDPWDGVDIDNAVASFFRALVPVAAAGALVWTAAIRLRTASRV